jgi:hypothetical protein
MPLRRREFEHVRLGLFGEIEQRLGAGEPEFSLQLLGPGALSGAELAAIAPDAPSPKRCASISTTLVPGLGEMHGRRKPGEAAADDDDVGRAVAVERRIFGRSPTVSSYQE